MYVHLQVLGDIDDLLEWFNDTERSITDADPVATDPDTLRAQLTAHRTLNDDVTQQKAKARDVIGAVKRLRRESSMDEDPLLSEKTEALTQSFTNVSRLSADRLGTLEQAVPLAAHFHDTHADLLTWFDETTDEITRLEGVTPGLDTEEIKVGQKLGRDDEFLLFAEFYTHMHTMTS